LTVRTIVVSPLVRWLPLSGVAFVACFALAVALYGSGAGNDPIEIVAYYASSANRLRQIGGFAALLAGCLFLLVYVVVVVREVVREEPLSTIALLGGAGAALLLAVGDALWAASALTAEIESGYRMSAPAHLLIEDAGFAVVVSGMAVAIPFVLAVSVATARSGRLPYWFALLGGVAVIGLAAAYWYLPLAAFLLWIACGSLLLARARPRPTTPSTRTTS
jgi:hypothetical protein